MDAPDFTLRQLSYLVTAADEGTVTAAAARLHVTPSAVSDALTELERAVGEQLCIRRRARGITLTSTGARMVSRARALLEDARELDHSLQSTEGELVGSITIGCYPALAPTILPPLLQAFSEAHPRVELSIVEATYGEIEGLLESGKVDLAFVYDTLIPGSPNRHRLYELPAHVLLPVGDPLAEKDAVRLEDMVDRDLILLDAPPATTHTRSLFAMRGMTPRIRYRTASYEAVRSLVGRGLGYGVLVQRPANTASYEGNPVVVKEITPAVPPVGIEVIWSASGSTPERTLAVIDCARSIEWFEAAR